MGLFNKGSSTKSARAAAQQQAATKRTVNKPGTTSHEIGAQQVGNRWGRANAYRNTHR